MRNPAHYKLFKVCMMMVMVAACAPVEPGTCNELNPLVPKPWYCAVVPGTSSGGSQQCDPTQDYSVQPISVQDTDGDGYGDDVEGSSRCVPQMRAFAMSHCNVHPGAPDSRGNGVDENCDGCDGIVGVDVNAQCQPMNNGNTSSSGSTSTSSGGSCESYCGTGCVAPEYACAADGSQYCNDCIAACHGTHLVPCGGGSTSSGGNNNTTSSSSGGPVIGDQMPSDPHYNACTRNLPNLLVNGSFYLNPVGLPGCGWSYEDHFNTARRSWLGSGWDRTYEMQAQAVGNPWDTQMKQNGIPIQSGRTYKLYIKVWVDIATRPLNIHLRNDSSPWNDYAQDANVSLDPGVWQVATVYFTASATASASLNIMMGDSTARYQFKAIWLEQQ